MKFLSNTKKALDRGAARTQALREQLADLQDLYREAQAEAYELALDARELEASELYV